MNKEKTESVDQTIHYHKQTTQFIVDEWIKIIEDEWIKELVGKGNFQSKVLLQNKNQCCSIEDTENLQVHLQYIIATQRNNYTLIFNIPGDDMTGIECYATSRIAKASENTLDFTKIYNGSLHKYSWDNLVKTTLSYELVPLKKDRKPTWMENFIEANKTLTSRYNVYYSIKDLFIGSSRTSFKMIFDKMPGGSSVNEIIFTSNPECVISFKKGLPPNTICTNEPAYGPSATESLKREIDVISIISMFFNKKNNNLLFYKKDGFTNDEIKDIIIHLEDVERYYQRIISELPQESFVSFDIELLYASGWIIPKDINSQALAEAMQSNQMNLANAILKAREERRKHVASLIENHFHIGGAQPVPTINLSTHIQDTLEHEDKVIKNNSHLV